MINPWHPMSDPCDIKHLGKLGEELNECGAAVSRCLIQGLYESEPTTGKLNAAWLEDEIADVLANINLVIVRFDLNISQDRIKRKTTDLRAWHRMA